MLKMATSGRYRAFPLAQGHRRDVRRPTDAASTPQRSGNLRSPARLPKKHRSRNRFFWRWDTAEKYQTNMRAYFRMISGIDHVVGRLVAELKKQGLAENTVIIYTADNGYYLGDRGFAVENGRTTMNLRVPLIVHDPRLPKAKQGKVVFEMALNSDLASTMIDLADLPVPQAHTGRSLAPLIGGKEVSGWRKDFLCEFLAVPNDSPLGRSARGTHDLCPLLCKWTQ